MDVSFSEEQQVLRDSARDFLERECPMSLVREQMDDARGLPEALWQAMSELGWCGLVVPEEHGGSGLGLIDMALLLEEIGRSLCPGPFLSTALVAATALRLGGSDAQRQRLLPEIAGGRLRFALAMLEDSGLWGPAGVDLAARPDGDGLVLDGDKRFVPDAPSADRLIVPVRTAPAADDPEAGISLVLVAPGAAGVDVRPVAQNEQSRKVADVRFEGVRVPADAVLGEFGKGWPLLSRVLDHARVGLCAELCGGAQKVLEASVEYARTREQFGQPIGRFQALQHRCADMLVAAEGIRSATYYAAWALDQGEPDAHTTACLAKAYCSEAYREVAGSAIQVHGGLGFTWEQDLHLYYKHAQAAELAFGSPSFLRAEAADDLIGPVSAG